jgi:CheY-like chemotaxis protein
LSSVGQTLKTVLVVEDNAGAREGLAAVLRHAGYGVVTAADGLEALVQLRAGSAPDLILLDMLMPVLDGWRFLDEIKKLAGSVSIPVVVTTSTILTPEWAAAQGCAGFLRKPVDAAELLQEVTRCLGS